MKKAYIRTFGCQMNVYDTGKMLALLKKDGFEQTEQMEQMISPKLIKKQYFCAKKEERDIWVREI